MRQTGKQILTIVAWLLLAGLARADNVLPDVVVDPLTGVAIEGYDPVSYFIDTEPRQGRPDYEYIWGGASWYFASAANRDVFKLNPDVYAPQHGGHCEMSLARGYLSDGKPRIFVIERMKLYLFYSAANREAFLLSPDEALAKASEAWPTLVRNLQGPAAEEPVGEPVTKGAAAEHP